MQISYSVGTSSNNRIRNFDDVTDAAQAFHNTASEERPYVVMTRKWMSSDTTRHQSAQVIAKTDVLHQSNQMEYHKTSEPTDVAFTCAYQSLLTAIP